MSFYADKVDYYTKSQVGKSVIRSDRQKAYEKYPSITINLSTINVSVDFSGQIASAVFDKEWVFQNDIKNTSGKVRSELRFSEQNGEWKIISEKDLKVYFVK